MWARQLARRASPAARPIPTHYYKRTPLLAPAAVVPAAAGAPWRESVSPHRASCPCCCSSSSRHFATRSSADTHLVEVLKSEIENALHEEANKQGSVKGSSGPFEVVDKPGTTEVQLTRTSGDEKITVTCVLEKQYNDEEAEEEGNSEGEGSAEESVAPVEEVHMYCTIAKGKKSVEIHCCYELGASEVEVESVAYSNETEEDKSDKPIQAYEGPAFQDLDDNLQKAFHDLIKARGISVKVASYVLEYLKVKEQREYMRWLHNVETFFSPPS